MPKRSLFAIDELKRVSRLEQWQVVGVDPGKRELVVAMDTEAPISNPVRYTQAQRLREISTQSIIQATAQDRMDRASKTRVPPALENLQLDPGDLVDIYRQQPRAGRRRRVAPCSAHCA